MNALWLRMMIVAAVTLMVGIMLTAIIVFVGVTGYLALLEATSPFVAAATISISALCVVAAVSVAAYLYLRHPSHSFATGARRDAGGERLLEDALGALGVELASVVRAHPRQSALASLVAGFSIGAVPELRDAVTQVFAKHLAK